jgi:WD40 repeat protein
MMNRIATLNEQPLDVIIDRKDPSLVYASCINGDLVIWHSNKNDDKDEDDDDGEGASSNVQIMPSYHRKSCRSLTQTPNGSLLISASKDKSLKAMDLTHNKQQFHWKRAHE